MEKYPKGTHGLFPFHFWLKLKILFGEKCSLGHDGIGKKGLNGLHPKLTADGLIPHAGEREPDPELDQAAGCYQIQSLHLLNRWEGQERWQETMWFTVHIELRAELVQSQYSLYVCDARCCQAVRLHDT